MTMSSEGASRSELLKDSEATLREVAGILNDLGADDTPSQGENTSGQDALNSVTALLRDLPALEEMVGIFFRTYREIVSVMESIRNGRGILHRAALERVQRTHQKIEEVSSATEVAAADMLDGLDRALALVDDLEPLGGNGNGGNGVDPTGGTGVAAAASPGCEVIQGQLREELHGLISILQFQDITAQQLSYAAGVMKDVEDRLASLVALFEVHGLIPDGEEEDEALQEPGEDGPTTFDPAASTEGAENRQALADEIFT